MDAAIKVLAVLMAILKDENHLNRAIRIRDHQKDGPVQTVSAHVIRSLGPIVLRYEWGKVTTGQVADELDCLLKDRAARSLLDRMGNPTRVFIRYRPERTLFTQIWNKCSGRPKDVSDVFPLSEWGERLTVREAVNEYQRLVRQDGCNSTLVPIDNSRRKRAVNMHDALEQAEKMLERAKANDAKTFSDGLNDAFNRPAE